MYWTRSMECGIPAIDAQHRELFRQAESLLVDDRQERILETFAFLERYVVDHFSAEETLHRKTSYPAAQEHRRQHASFVDTFLTLRAEYDRSGYNLTTLLKINSAVVAWLKDHVLGSDREFGDYYSKARETFGFSIP